LGETQADPDLQPAFRYGSSRSELTGANGAKVWDTYDYVVRLLAHP
jgi:hypothetical protein